MKKLTESQIQKDCVAWFHGRYPSVGSLFFAVPNGGARNGWTAKILKDEGVTAGVADLILLVPRHGYAALAIEMKTPEGRQQQSQKIFEELCRKYRTKYVICRSLTDFQAAVMDYLER